MEVLVADFAGYCYGVQRAINTAINVQRPDGKEIYTLGPLIHNPQAVNVLERYGIKPIKNKNEAKKGDVVVIRSHGAPPDVIEEFEQRGIKVIDATCPFVKKAQQRAVQLLSSGYQVLIIGEPNHPEVVGIKAYAKNRATVVSDSVKHVELEEKVGIVVQTTQSIKNLISVTEKLLPGVAELKIHNTICDETVKRQESAERLAKMVDIMIVVGGHNSANTNRLSIICKKAGAVTYQIETSREINSKWFKDADKVGVTAGASTPDWLLEEVLKVLDEIVQSREA